MSEILIAGEIRRRFKAALADAAITLDSGWGSILITILNPVSENRVVPPEKLPALYVFNSGERLGYDSLSEVARVLSLDVVLMAHDEWGQDPMDQLDDMQLGVERAMLAAGGFDLARQNRLVSVEIAQHQGAVLIGNRVMRYEITYGVTPDDPSL